LWKTETGEPGPPLVGHDRNVFGIAFRGDGEQLASAGDDGKVILWNLATAEPIRTYHGYGTGFHSVVFRDDGQQLAAGTSDGTELVWDAETGDQLHQLTLHGRPVESLSWPTDGAHLAACDGPGFKVWRMPDAVEVASVPQALTRTVAFSPDGSTLACGVGRDVQLYDAATWQRVAEMNAHANEVYGLAFSADGRRMATSSKTGTLKLWDVKTRQSMIVLTNAVSDIADATPRPVFSPDGKWIVAGRHHGQLQGSTRPAWCLIRKPVPQ
jgi:WD40 repeat protein